MTARFFTDEEFGIVWKGWRGPVGSSGTPTRMKPFGCTKTTSPTPVPRQTRLAVARPLLPKEVAPAAGSRSD